MRFDDSIAAGLKPDPIMTVSDWADQHRFLSSVSSAEPGKYRTDRTPYLRQIMDDLSHMSPIKEVIFKKASQIGATEAGNCWMGYVVDYAPGPMLVVQPTDDAVKKFSRQRVEPLFQDTPRIRLKVGDKKSRTSEDTIKSKSFPGGIIVLTGANSPVGLASMPARYLFLDEVDRFPLDVGGEGDPSKLAKRRQSTFSKSKTFECSTPTEDDTSRIAADFEKTDQKFYFVPCPHCDHAQELIWEQIKWDAGNPDSVKYQCIKCETLIDEFNKTKMLNAGNWVATAECSNKKVSGYHLNALYSPLGWYSWADCVRDYEEALEDEGLLKVFTNTILGLTYRESHEQPSWKALWEKSRGCEYKFNTVPHGTCFITAGCDVQKDRLEVEIVGWARNKVSYSIDYRVFLGDTTEPEVWLELEKMLYEEFPTDTNKMLPIEKLGVDTGYNTQVVYNWIRRQRSSKVLALKGRETQAIPLSTPTPVDVKTFNGKKIKRGLKLWHVGVNILKEELYKWLVKDLPGENEPIPYGFCYFLPYGEEFFKQLTAEVVKTKLVSGREKRYFEKTRERNEALDCRIYARAVANAYGMDRFKEKHWLKMETELGYFLKETKRVTEKQVESPRKVTETKPPPKRQQKTRSSYL